MTPPWSGYTSQSLAWRRGYDWARDEGPHAALGCVEATEAWGYDFATPESDDFDKGASFAQREQLDG